MSTYAELKAQIKELEAKAAEARLQEVDAAKHQIFQLMATYNLKLTDLEKPGSKKAPRKAVEPVQAKYKDPVSGATWTGRGREPKWIVGANRDSFLI